MQMPPRCSVDASVCRFAERSKIMLHLLAEVALSAKDSGDVQINAVGNE